MGADDFRKIALGLPEVSESSHMNHPDFRVGGKIFATLSSGEELLGMVKLTPAQQSTLTLSRPDVFRPVPGGWGRQGCTHVVLEAATDEVVRAALIVAWQNRASPRLAKEHGDL